MENDDDEEVNKRFINLRKRIKRNSLLEWSSSFLWQVLMMIDDRHTLRFVFEDEIVVRGNSITNSLTAHERKEFSHRSVVVVFGCRYMYDGDWRVVVVNDSHLIREREKEPWPHCHTSLPADMLILTTAAIINDIYMVYGAWCMVHGYKGYMHI